MRSSVFIDTGAFIARVSAGDQHHAEACRGWDRLRDSGTAMISSEPVLIESANFLSRAQGGRFTAQWLRRHLESAEIRWLQPSVEQLREAVGEIDKLSDQRISFTDATSFALMRHHAIPSVFGFDRHFAMAGFALWPEHI